jgi:hypothetical protein
MLDNRIRSSKDRTIGTGDTDPDLWLLQYGLRIAGTPTHTVRELNEQFVSKFRSITIRNFGKNAATSAFHLKTCAAPALFAASVLMSLPTQRKRVNTSD